MQAVDDPKRFRDIGRERDGKLQLAEDGFRLLLRRVAIANDEHERGGTRLILRSSTAADGLPAIGMGSAF